MSPLDSNVEPNHEVPLWNETRWNGCWSPEDGVGLYMHAGRFRGNLDLWWVQSVAYLPDGRVCVDRSWGPNPSEAGVSVGCLDLRIAEDGWTSAFDGVGQLTTTAELARATRGSSAPSRRMTWDVEASAAAPLWDMYAGKGDARLDHAGDAHVQQGYFTKGALKVGDEEHSLDGIGFKDHSSGPRDFGPWKSHRYMQIVTDDWTAHMIVMDAPDGSPTDPWGAFLPKGGEQQDITRFELPTLTHADGGPVEGDLVFETSGGERFEFASELVHALPMTITEDNDNINGVDWELEGDPIVLIEGKGRLTAADGTVAYCFHERSARRSAVQRPG